MCIHDDVYSISRNPIGDDGLAAIMEALIERPDALKKLGYMVH